MMKRALLKSQSGFTLIELMIVVGIIGILVAIAGPNFARYQSKARQSEAKIALGAMYAAEKSFYSEYSAYIASLDAIGYTPEGLKRFYSVGFNAASGTVSGYSAATTTQSVPRINYPAGWTTCTPSLAEGVISGNDPQNFTAAASGQVRQNQGCDNWRIDDSKNLVNSSISL